jgi:hypothetical protein
MVISAKYLSEEKRMSRSKHKRSEKKSASVKVLEERRLEKKAEQLKLGLPEPVQPKKPPVENVKYLSKGKYAKHACARDIMLTCVGTTSQLVHKALISQEEADNALVEGAKKAIRKTGIGIAVRAWKEVNTQMIRTGSITLGEGKDKEVVPLYWEPLADFWRTQGVKSVKFTELVQKKNKVQMVCESCGKTKAVKLSEKLDMNLCMYCRAKVSKGLEVQRHE